MCNASSQFLDYVSSFQKPPLVDLFYTTYGHLNLLCEFIFIINVVDDPVIRFHPFRTSVYLCTWPSIGSFQPEVQPNFCVERSYQILYWLK